ncbi:MAG: histidine kinase [Bacteroidota bacterium]
MKFNWKGLIFFFLLYFFVGDPLRELIMVGQTDILIYDDGFKDICLMQTSLWVFFLYCLMAYSCLYFFFPRKQWMLCIGGILLSFLLPIGVRYLIQEIWFDQWFGFTNYPKGISAMSYIRDNLYFSFRFVFFGLFYYLITFSFDKEKREKGLRIANQKMELSLLRSQINPHFLLNSLNNIYSLVYHQSEKSLEALDTLCGLLKYSLYETKETVSIREEMAYVEQFISLNRLRFSYPLVIELEVEEAITDVLIPQFILVPLIENAFKHGELKDPTMPLHLQIRKEREGITIRVRNKIGYHVRDATGGIGLDNLQKRLELIYGEAHQFRIEESAEKFSVSLYIPML